MSIKQKNLQGKKPGMKPSLAIQPAKVAGFFQRTKASSTVRDWLPEFHVWYTGVYIPMISQLPQAEKNHRSPYQSLLLLDDSTRAYSNDITLMYQLYSYRRKFRSQTSDNMDRWKAEQGRGREKRKIRRKKSRRERVRRKKMQMREKVGKSRNTVFFPMICGSGG